MAEPVHNAVAAACREAEARFGVPVSAGQVEALAAFAGELVRWNAKVNLTSIVDPEGVAEKHLLDSLAVAPWLEDGMRVVDVGTGGGLPGIPLAIVRPGVRFLLVDRTDKKVTFLKAVAAKLRLANVEARHARVEPEVPLSGAPFDLAVSRAFAEPGAWLPLARTLVRPGGTLVAMLGSDVPAGEARAAALGPDRLVEERSFRLPSGAQRTLWRVERA